jgi:hypothetical protein
VAGWQIERSTLPWRRGQRLGLADRIASDGVPRAEAGEVWSVAVNTLSPAELRDLFAPRR